MIKQVTQTLIFILSVINIKAQHTYGSFYTNDALVNYVLSGNKSESATIVMVPGHNLSTYIYITTPDRRKGWADMFADKGYNVYMVNDPVYDFATSGFIAPFTIPSGGKSATAGSVKAWQSDIWKRWGFGSVQGTPYANAQFPTDSFSNFDKYYPYIGSSSFSHDAAIKAVIDSIGGKVWILSHSAGAQPTVLAAEQRKSKLNGMILIEPAGPPDSTNFPALNGLHMFGVYGDYITSRNQTSRKVATESAATLFNNSGGTADVVSLPDDSSVYGNSHIMMQDKNSSYVFNIVEYWLRQFSPQVPPILKAIPNQTGTTGSSFNFTLKPYAIKTNSDSILSYSLSGTLPNGLSFSSSTGVISGIPTTAGTTTFIATCSDNDGVSNKDTFDISIVSVQIPPILNSIPNQNGTVGTSFNLALRPFVNITNGDSILSFSMNGTLPSGLSFNSTNGVLSGIPTIAVTNTIIATCTDNDGISNKDTFDISINPKSTTNTNPKANKDSFSLNDKITIVINPSINDTDIDGDSLTITKISSISQGTISIINSNKQIQYTSPINYSGTTTCVYTISDGKGGLDSAMISFKITDTTTSTNSILPILNNAVKIYPNPTSENIFIENYLAQKEVDCELFDIKGKILLKIKLLNVNSKINIEDLPLGVYYLEVKAKTQIITRTKIEKR